MQYHWCCPRTLRVALLTRAPRGHVKVHPTEFFLALRCSVGLSGRSQEGFSLLRSAVLGPFLLSSRMAQA